MRHLQDLPVLILGLGASGLAMARWCASQGAQVTVADTREQPPGLQALQQAWPAVRCLSGAFTADLLRHSAARAVFRSPGLTPDEIAPVFDAARSIGLWLGGELDLFVRALAELRESRAYAPRILAVTGTNGKTTVTALTGQLLERAGRRVAVAGNIGPTLLDTLSEALARDDLPEDWVLELSSFQLDGVNGFEPTAATLLNLSQDHLDWHGSMAAYAAAKARVFGQQALMVLNRDDAAVLAMRPQAPAVRSRGPRTLQRPWCSFGADLPSRPGDFGLEEVNGMVWLVRAHDDDAPGANRRGEAPEIHLQRLMPADALRLRGRHNALNALAALALGVAAGCAIGPMLYGLREYRGEPHRVQPVALIEGVEYFDDSKGTNVGATVAALQGLGRDRRVVVILGGVGKGQDFGPLAEPVARFARAVVLIGRDAPLVRAVLAATGVPLQDAPDMAQAVQAAARLAHSGDAVLMSPACASFDMFDNYGHRARVFVQAVAALAEQAGVALEGAA